MGNHETRRRFKTEKARRFALVKRIIFLVLALCAVIAACVSLDYISKKLFAKPVDDGLILPNVYVAGVNIGGMSTKDARNALQVALYDSYATDPLVVNLPGDALVLSPLNTGARLDVEAVVNLAYQYGRSGTDIQNAAIRQEAENKY